MEPALHEGGWGISDFGERLKQARLAAGISQRELARRAKVSGPYVTMMESKGRVPSRPVERRLALALGLPASYFAMPASAGREVAVPIDAEGQPDGEVTSRHVLFIHDHPEHFVREGDIGILGSREWSPGHLAVIRRPDGNEQLVKLVSHQGLKAFQPLGSSELVIFSQKHEIIGVITKIERSF